MDGLHISGYLQSLSYSVRNIQVIVYLVGLRCFLHLLHRKKRFKLYNFYFFQYYPRYFRAFIKNNCLHHQPAQALWSFCGVQLIHIIGFRQAAVIFCQLIIILKTMSSEKSKQKKPFLKRGSRQFLSNAQVRSQSSKPKIVDFGAADDQFIAPLKTRSSQNVDPNCDDIKIKVAPSSTKVIPPPKSKEQQPPKQFQRPPTNHSQRPADVSAGKQRRQTSIGKRKQAALSDYLDNDSNLHEDHSAKKIPLAKSEVSKRIVEQKKPIQKKPTQQRDNLKHTYLVQQEQDDQQQPNFFENDSFKPFSNPLKNREPVPPQKNQYNNKVQPKPMQENNRRKKSDSDSQGNKEEINFVSDNSDEQESVPRFNVAKNATKNVKFNNLRQEAEDQTVSKIKMNYFNKNNEKPKTSAHIQQGLERDKISSTKRALTMNEIPKQIKQQIIKQTIAEKEQELHQQLQKLREKFTVVNKEKSKIEEEQKALMKARQEFEKEMQQKTKEFEQKLKNENSKLAREKKYMKDAQMAGQGDRKVKVQIEQMKKQVEKEREERKKIESKYKLEVENLRKKLGEETEKNKLLIQQIKLLEYGKVIHQEQLQQMVKEQKKNSVQIHRASMWADAPQTTFLARFLEEGFSLIELDSSRFHYEENQYYQYYLKVKDNHSQLELESADQQRAKRQYKNGKVEVEQFQKYLKEIFPFNYTVVTLWNGDIKQTLPDGTLVYFSQNSGATQYCLKNSDVQKQIVYFPSSETVQMKVMKPNNPAGDFHEVYCSGHLKRTLSDGTVILEKKDNRGKIISMTGNM